MFKFNNGDKVRDRISGFTGVITCRQQWFNGCIRYAVAPRGTKSTEYVEPRMFDEQELELVKKQHVPSETAEAPPRRARAPGGPRTRAVTGRTER